MSKYTEAEVLSAIKTMGLFRTTYPKDVVEKVVNNALKIADRLEQADADVYNKCCEVCTSLTICKERGEVCDEASVWEDGYNQALSDLRGDNNG